MTALLIVRAIITNEADRPKFDHWYATDHMPKAIALMGTQRSWRYWSHIDPSVHYAVYQCSDIGNFIERKADALRAEFDAAWPNVTRTRDVLEQVDEFPKSL